MTTYKVNHGNELVIYQFTDETLGLLYQYTKVIININANLDFSFYPHLQYITFRCGYNQITDLTKNINLVMVDFGSDYNQPLYLPVNLKVLALGEAFNQPMYELPSQLEKLIINVNIYEHQIIMPNTVIEAYLYGNFMNYITVSSNLHKIYAKVKYNHDMIGYMNIFSNKFPEECSVNISYY